MKKIVVFGASKAGQIAFEKLKSDYEIVAFCDNDLSKIGGKYKGIDIISIEILSKYSDAEIVVASSAYNEIVHQLLEYDIKIKGIYDIKTHEIKEYEDIYAVSTYSQDGEDILLREIFYGQEYGTYIDVGAHHPFRLSNTYVFYKLGWRGINIEPNPIGIDFFNSYRPEDKNIMCGVANQESVLKYYMFEEPALNRFTEDYDLNTHKLKEIKMVQVRRLKDILSEIDLKTIDFMSIDVEKLEIEVLKSNDWNQYRPKVILIEQLNTTIEEILDSEIFKFMKKVGYTLHSKYNRTSFYKDTNYIG